MVVPVEPVSLTIGVVALASLFSTCVECFDYFKAGEALEEDFDLTLVKLDIEKTRLLIWGNNVGILKPEGEGRVEDLNHSEIPELIGRCLEKIKSLLSDTDKLQSLYGLRPSTGAHRGARSHSILSVNSMIDFKTSYRRFCARFAGSLGRSSLAMRTRWAIHDKTKFEGLVNHLKDLVDGLNEVVLVKREIQDQIMHDDIVSILDISKLQIIESACEGSYTTLARVASTVREASEFGTIDRRNLEERLVDAQGLGEDDFGNKATGIQSNGTCSNGVEACKQAPLFENISGLHHTGSIYFVLTGQCGDQVSRQPCELNDLGTDCTNYLKCIVNNNVATSHWSIGKCITDTLDPERMTDIDLDTLLLKNDEELTELQKLALPLASIFIYCAPCACLVATALAICRDAGRRATTYFQFLIRPDDRLISTCCSQKDRSVGLVSVVEKIKDIERMATYNANSPLNAVDKFWVEQRLFELEENEYPGSSADLLEMGGKVFSEHKSGKKTAGIIVLGEVEYSLPLMQAPPFLSTPRVPKETEIFQMNKDTYRDGKYHWSRKYLGTYTPKTKPTPPISPSPRSGVQSTSAGTRPISTSFSSIPSMSAILSAYPTQYNLQAAMPRHISPSLSPASKRQKTSTAGSVTMDDTGQTSAETQDMQSMFSGLPEDHEITTGSGWPTMAE